MFRGRGKFKDGNIPKKSTRRSKAAQKPDSNKYEDDESVDKETLGSASIHDDERNELVHVPILGSLDLSEAIAVGHITEDEPKSVEELFDESVDEEVIRKELDHLQKRIANIQESIQLSQSSLCSPSRWESNCLNAVRNCVNEWRNIVTHHGKEWTVSIDEKGTEINDDNDGQIQSDLCKSRNGDRDLRCMDPDSECSKSCALKIFGLIQLSLQCGPLKGSNPAYFKRCGGDVAKMAHNFLSCIVIREGKHEFQNLRFTEKQCLAIQKWMKNAEKAIELNRPPSKSAIKLQQTNEVANRSRKKKKKLSRK